MIFYDLPLDIKNLVLSYNLGDVRLLKIQNNNTIKHYMNRFKPVHKSSKLHNMHYLEIDNINMKNIIKNGISYIFNLSELDKLHQKHKPLKLLIEYEIFVTSTSFT